MRYDFEVLRGDEIIVAERVVATGLRDVWSRIARMAEDVDEPGCQIRVTEEAGGRHEKRSSRHAGVDLQKELTPIGQLHMSQPVKACKT